MTLTHPEGLRLRIPAHLQVEQRPQGFRINSSQAKDLRVPEEVDVSLATKPAPEGSWPERRVSGGRDAFYRVDGFEGGSAGSEYVLMAWVAYAEGHVLVKQATQAEWPSTPDFSLAWTVLDGLEAPAP